MIASSTQNCSTPFFPLTVRGTRHRDHAEAEQPVELVGRDLELEAVALVQGLRRIGRAEIGRELLEHGAHLDAVAAQRDALRLGDAGGQLLDADDFGVGKPGFQRVVVESARARADGAGQGLRREERAGLVGVGGEGLPPSITSAEGRPW